MVGRSTSAERIYAMLGNESLWNVAVRCHRLLQDAGIPHAIVGGVAVCLHGYQRNTVDVDILVRREDAAGIRSALQDAGFVWSSANAEFRSPAGIPVQCVLSGDRAGKGSDVY